MGQGFRWHVNDLSTYSEVLQWYLDLNSGGTVHTEEELNRVQQLLSTGASYDNPSEEMLKEWSGFHRSIFQSLIK